MDFECISNLPKEKLLELIEIYAKNWLATDGLWFQAAEARDGMDVAMAHDIAVWRRYTVIEARRIKQFLEMPEQGGLHGLRQALRLRLYAPLNRDEIEITGNALIYRVRSCRVQEARKNKNMPLHPCKEVGLVEYDGFAKTIDPRFTLECVSCYPELTDNTCSCIWKFILQPEEPGF